MISAIQTALSSIRPSLANGGLAVLGQRRAGRRPGFKMSAEARAKIAAAQRRRWAKVKGKV